MPYELVCCTFLSLIVGIVQPENILTLKRGDSYTEELVIKRLKSENILTQFRFIIKSGIKLGPDYQLFPRIVGEILTKYEIKEFHFSLTQGVWWTQEWGIQPQPATPTGAQVYAWFHGSESRSVDERWNNFINSLNGIFCSSLLEIVPSYTAIPTKTYSLQSSFNNTSDHVIRYGALPSETVCTENLTPWKKLLPCKQTGLSTLLNPAKLYRSDFHSMGIHVYQICEDQNSVCIGRTYLELNLNMVTGVNLRTRSLNWSIEKLFGKNIGSKCSIADSSVVIFERDREVELLQPIKKLDVVVEVHGRKFHLYDLTSIESDSFPFNIKAIYKINADLSHTVPETMVSIQSFLGGISQQSGRIVNRFINRQSVKQYVIYTHVIPWFMRVYFHSITLNCFDAGDDSIKKHGQISDRQFVPAKDRVRPFLLEFSLTLPSYSLCELSFELDKAFLRVSEYPPDANHGRYIPAPSLSFAASDLVLLENITVYGGYLNSASEQIRMAKLPIRHITIYGNVLLVRLPVPDFSMPFNVICLVCTVIAMLFGPVHSLTTKILIPLSKEDKDLAPLPPLRKFVVFLYQTVKSILMRLIRKKVKKE